MQNLVEKIKESSEFIKKQITIEPEIGLILGSGLGVLADQIDDAVKISYHDIPNFPVSTVEGHQGQLVIGSLEGKKVIAMQGRFHYYEGYSQQEVTFPVRVMKALGVKKLIVTNAAGGVNTAFEPGDLMLIDDHINFMFNNPLIGPNHEELGVRFPDMSQAYSKELIEKTKRVASELQIDIRNGVYAAFTGPIYETPAEIRMIRTIGGDAVGMSTVPEVIAANHAGIKVLGISCITNMAAGILPQPLSHAEVIETTNLVQAKFLSLVKGIVREI